MDAYNISIIVFLLISIVIMLFVSSDDPDEDSLKNSSTIRELRSRQVVGLREHALKQKLEENVENTANVDKKATIEHMLMRAGLDNWTYGEFVMVKVALTIITLIVSWLFIKNIVITAVVTVVTYLLPGQIIQFISNRRTHLMEEDIGTFIQLTVERYKVHGDFQRAVKQSAPDFEGREPIYSEIRKTILEFNIGTPTAQAIKNMGKRTGNRYIGQLANYYDIASTIGTEASRDDIIGQAWNNYNEDSKMKMKHQQEIQGPKTDAYIIVGALPLLMLYQAQVDENYIPFFMDTVMGQIGLAVILTVTILSLLFINKKIGAPLD